jgi:predicted transcriptional regulator
LLIQDFIRNRRNELGFTQVELANKAEFSVSVVKRFEDDKPYNPRGRTLLKMVKVLKVEGETLLFDCQWP